jgi:hypothetical protein
VQPPKSDHPRLAPAGRKTHAAAARSAGLAAVCLLLLGSPALAATPEGARNSISARTLRRHVEFLASDTLEGRAAGSQGGRAAAAYLAQQLRQAGLRPGADDGDYLQPFGGSFQNLLALVPGSSAELQKEVIIVSGHFDHVGFGNRSNSFGPFGQIHNGADDNASGTAAVLEVARALASVEPSPRRTVLFALWDAEEGGLLGSRHWLDHPTRPLDNVKIMINCDMIGRLRNDVLVVYGSRTAAGLRQRVSEANHVSGLTFNFDWRQRDDSDHWPFFRQGIAYLLLHTGDHLDYHRPSDDVDKVNYEGLQTLTQLLFELTRQLADADELPPFRVESREERPWNQEQAQKLPPPRQPRLGLSWDGSRQPGEPFRVVRVDAESPAAQARLQIGDRIVAFADCPCSQVDDFAGIVLCAPRQTTCVVERSGQAEPITLQIALRGNPVRFGLTWKTDDAEPAVAILTQVVEGSPAQKAGLEPLDRLLPPPGEQREMDAWLRELADSTEPVTLRVERRGRIREVVVHPLQHLR